MKRAARLGLAAAVWFAALARAGHDLWAATALFAWLTLLALMLLWERRSGARPLHAPLALPLLGWAAAAALSQLGSYDANTTFLEIRIWIFCLLFFFLLVNSAETPAEREEFFFAAGASVVPVGLIAVWECLTAWHVPGEATLINSAEMAGFALCWIFFLGRRTAKTRLALAPFAASVAAFVIARSWWAYVSLAFGWAVANRALLRDFYRRRSAWAAALAGVAAAAVVAIVVFRLRLRSGSYVGISRLYYARAAALMFARNLRTGVGLGGFQSAYPYFRAANASIPNTLFVHDFPLQILAETGLCGAAAAVVVGLCFWGRIRATNRTDLDPNRGSWIAALAALLCFSLTSIFMDYFLSKLLVMSLLALLVGHRASDGFRLRPLWSGAAAAALLLLSVFWLRPFGAGRLLSAGIAVQKEGDLARAEILYRDATNLDSTLADADWALYLLEKKRWEAGRSPEDFRRAEADLREALRYKHDPLFDGELERLSAARRGSQ